MSILSILPQHLTHNNHPLLESEIPDSRPYLDILHMHTVKLSTPKNPNQPSACLHVTFPKARDGSTSNLVCDVYAENCQDLNSDSDWRTDFHTLRKYKINLFFVLCKQVK